MIQTTPNLSTHGCTLISLTGYPFLRAYFHDIFDFPSQDMAIRIRQCTINATCGKYSTALLYLNCKDMLLGILRSSVHDSLGPEVHDQGSMLQI